MSNFIFSILIVTLIYGSVRDIEASCDDSSEFTCDDGTSISICFQCDGEIHCPDGSDETRKLCVNHKCQKFMFQCSYGACIDLVKKCDGKQDCADNSDESNERCPSSPPINHNYPQICSLGYFQCDNNECIDEFAVCDGVENCSDGSDESEGVCKHFPCSRKLGYQCDYGACVKKNSRCDGIQDCRDGSDERNCFSQKSSNKELPEGCFLPIQPDNGSYTVKDCAAHEECRTIIGTKVALGTQLQYNCDKGFELSERKNTIKCTHIGWCPPPYIFCQACGSLQGPIGLVTNGIIAIAEEHPWNVGVYLKKNRTHDMICGGSIITSSLVITAAHCVVYSKHQYANPSDIKVAVGKTFRSWDSIETNAQILDVIKIHVHEDYKQHIIQTNYAFDVALLETKKDIVFGRTAYPVCFVQETSSIRSGSMGTVVGWGKDETNKLSKVLKSVQQRFMDHADCTKNYINVTHFTHTTVCGLYENSSEVQRGDSGAGFIFEINGKHYLRGIVSSMISYENTFATYTDVTIDSIHKFISETRLNVAIARND